MEKKNTKLEKSQLMLLIMFGLLLLEIIIVPLLVYARIVKILPVIFFLVLPTVLAIGLFILARNALADFNRKKKKILENK